MSFTQFEYPILLLVVAILVWLLPGNTARKWVLLGSSCYFYAYWDWRFFGLLAFSTLFDWSIARGMEHLDQAHSRENSTDEAASSQLRWRRALLIISLCGNLGLLGFFKYCNFFIESAAAIVEPWGWHPGTLSIILPVGISFYTFQTMSYTIDVYRRQLPARTSLLDFALYVTFFPQLVAGPIVRAGEFLPQLAQRPRWSNSVCYAGLQQILRGYVKKLLIADQLARLSDAVFGAPEMFTAPTMTLGLLAYAGQIYCDFSGYSDIAIGSGKVLGLMLPENFRHPYLSTSPQEFWRRWHMSLSTWLRDYVYIPLGGSQRGTARTYIHLMLTMTLGGLWHGAAWTFVLWGVWHGLLLCVDRAFFAPRREKMSQTSRLFSIAGGFITFACVLFGWSLFRAGGIGDVRLFWSSLLTGGGQIAWYPPTALIPLAVLIVEHALWATRYRGMLELPADRWYTPWLTGLALWALLLFAPHGFRPFVYFQF